MKIHGGSLFPAVGEKAVVDDDRLFPTGFLTITTNAVLLK